MAAGCGLLQQKKHQTPAVAAARMHRNVATLDLQGFCLTTTSNCALHVGYPILLCLKTLIAAVYSHLAARNVCLRSLWLPNGLCMQVLVVHSLSGQSGCSRTFVG